MTIDREDFPVNFAAANVQKKILSRVDFRLSLPRLSSGRDRIPRDSAYHKESDMNIIDDYYADLLTPSEVTAVWRATGVCDYTTLVEVGHSVAVCLGLAWNAVAPCDGD